MIMSKEETIRAFGGQILGTIYTDSDGSQTLKKFGGLILGTYDAQSDVTKEFGGKIISNGNTLISLLYK